MSTCNSCGAREMAEHASWCRLHGVSYAPEAAAPTVHGEAPAEDTPPPHAIAIIRDLLASAVPHPKEHPTMWAAWERAHQYLAGQGLAPTAVPAVDFAEIRAAHAATSGREWLSPIGRIPEDLGKVCADDGMNEIGEFKRHEDAAFVILAHEAVPALIDRIDRARAAVGSRSRLAIEGGFPGLAVELGKVLTILNGESDAG